MKIKIPDNNDPRLVEVVKSLIMKKFRHQIVEIYGKPTKNQYFGSGRSNILFDNMARENVIERVKNFQDLEINYNYSMNGIIPRARILENRDKIIEELKWIESSPIRQITLANYEMAQLALKYCPSVDVTISFFAEINNKEKLKQWSELPNIKTIITASSTYRNIPLLKDLVETGKRYGIGISVIANLGCMSDCIRKEEHAIMKDMSSVNSSGLHYAPCTFYCMEYLLENPEKFLQLPIIRPEDLEIYEKIGIESIKLVDRNQTTDWIEKVTSFYLSGSYDGNILDLTCNFTTLNNKRHENSVIKSIRPGKSRKSILEYREILPELMDIKIHHDYNFLSCNNTCANCKGCKDNSVIFDKNRRKIVLKQLNDIKKKYLFI